MLTKLCAKQAYFIKPTHTFAAQALFPPTTSVAINRFLFPTLAVIPPIAVAFATNDLTSLVGFTGSYAGAGVQYIVPAFLVLLARREAVNISCRSDVSKNPHRFVFVHRLLCKMLICETCRSVAEFARYEITMCQNVVCCKLHIDST